MTPMESPASARPLLSKPRHVDLTGLPDIDQDALDGGGTDNISIIGGPAVRRE